jgi:putative hydrolase of the HAD superfamily
MVKVVAFDADDTLWHNEHLFLETRDRFTALLAGYHEKGWIEDRLYETELRNLGIFGYGIKGFALSMIETAIDLTETRVTGADVAEIIELAKGMLDAPVTLIDGAEETLKEVAGRYRAIIVTKGDLFDQETKLARSGLGNLVDTVEVVSDKSVNTYRRIMRSLAVSPEEFVMVGNSLRSDILPVIEIGGHAVFVSYETTWEHESVSDTALERLDFLRAESIADVPALLERFGEPRPRIPG